MRSVETSTAAIVAFLKKPAAHPELPRGVTVVETHFAWVFMTDTHVRKLKKAVRNDGVDLSLAHLRSKACHRELAINRPLGGDVYEAVEPIVRTADGCLRIGAVGEVVDAVLRMRRLPASRALDQRARVGRVLHLGEVADRLADFYRRGAIPPAVATARPGVVREQLDELGARLRAGPLAVEARVLACLAAFVRHHEAAFVARAAAGFVVDGHGDLRPEHVYLTEPPRVLDRLEFDPALRQMDWQEDVALLAVDLEWQGRGWVGNALQRAIAARLDDRAPRAFWAFHKAWRACLRARLCADHRLRPGRFDPGTWVRRGRAYMQLAHRHARALDRPGGD